jgi:hypothetical protein
MADDDTTPITPDRSRREAPDRADAGPDADAPGTADVPGTAAAEAHGLEPEPVARPGWRSRLARVPRTPAIAGGVLALVLLSGAGGFALGHAAGDRDGHRPPWDGERVSEGVPGTPGDGDGHGRGLPPAGLPQAPQGVLPGAPVVPPPAVGDDDDGDGDGDGDGGTDLDGDDGGSGSGADSSESGTDAS